MAPVVSGVAFGVGVAAWASVPRTETAPLQRPGQFGVTSSVAVRSELTLPRVRRICLSCAVPPSVQLMCGLSVGMRSLLTLSGVELKIRWSVFDLVCGVYGGEEYGQRVGGFICLKLFD